jgi:class 3 adenylate cyclase
MGLHLLWPGQVFPRHIVAQLKAGLKPEIERKEEVSVLFIDIVGFTTLSSKLSAVQVSDMLDRFFTRLDHLIRDLDLYKVGRRRRSCASGREYPVLLVLALVLA